MPSLPLTFSGGAALVTGAASGIGAAIARTLMGAGIATIRVDVRLPHPEPDRQHQFCCAADVRDVDLLGTLRHQGAPVNDVAYVVNCAGILDDTGFSDVDRNTWLRCLDINLMGAYNVINTFTTVLRQRSPAAVVNITSIEAGRVIALSNPDPTPHYAASKAGLHMLTQSSARALAPIRVNSVAPGFVATPMAATHGDTSTFPAQLADRVPAGRFAAPEEIANTVAFLLSDQASYITGSELRVDGGFQLT
ncbi:SDR family NAD(P)-dependent oxidoreductase [Mycobacterium sp. MS1601]|uniref:SDR family NAD(P)-dependent oxidoreductase n=1 Tax=Mycobacterium sp. MS1601 TaxID=1936029 RepID=UPI001F3C0237|nr:SDR family oxidoreductase [Mycobacterium sp. MS1601]